MGSSVFLEQPLDYSRYSVLMPLFYKEKIEHLQLSVESMMSQTVKPDEVVFIEDHPISDEMRETIGTLSKQYGVKVVIYSNHELDGKGLAAVLAFGVTKCKNSLIARMDTDDVSLPERCEKELNVFQNNPGLAMVGSWVDEFYGDISNTINVRTTPQNTNEIKKRFRYTNPFNHPAIMFRKEAIIDAGNYRTDLPADEDYDLWYRVIRKGYEGYNIQESLVRFRLGENFAKRRRNKNAFKAKKTIKKRMYKDGFMNVFQFLISMALEVVYLLCPFDIRKLLFRREKRKIERSQNSI